MSFNQKIQDAWNKRCELCAEGRKLYTEGNKLYTEGKKLYTEGNKLYAERDKLYAEGDKLYAEGDKLCAEGDKLCAEGRKLYAEGNIQFYNAIILEFGKDCKVEWDCESNPIIQGWTYVWGGKGPDSCKGKLG